MPALALREVKPRERKRKLIDEMVEIFSSHKTIALADISGLRALQFQRLRKALRGSVQVKVAKNSIIRKAIEELKELKGMDFSPLKDFLTGQVAVLASNLSPFEVYALLEKNKVPAKARPGDVAVKDVVIPAGNTGIPSGPALSLFKKFKVPVKVEEGSIYVTKDTVVVKAGEAIPAEIAELLGKLGIEPMEAGLKIKIAFYEGVVFKPSDLKIDVEKYKKDIADAFTRALSLAINAVFVTPESAPYIISKAVAEARNLAINACYPTREVVGHIIAKAYAQATALRSLLKL
ncbi:MAG: 50S ribosomal protein L10 [Candidatus Verstraetearchaeota archaeon]|nr:50S ribosomal protein L10 [Candidatus Verstraetearchaeota archaeon]